MCYYYFRIKKGENKQNDNELYYINKNNLQQGKRHVNVITNYQVK